MTFMEKEISEQPSVLFETLTINKDIIKKISNEVEKRHIKTIIFSARGSSDNTGVYFKYMIEVFSHIPVSLAAPSVFTLYNSDLDFSNSLVIGVSQSGAAEDVLSVINSAKKQNALTVTLTNYTDSKLAKASDFHLHLGVGEEKSVAATKTFTSELYLLGLLAASIAKNDDLYNELLNVPNEIEHIMEKKEDIKLIAKSFAKSNDCFVLGRSFQYAIAKEMALKLQETTYIKAIPFAISDFYHGPFALADELSNIIVFAPKDETWENSIKLIDDLKKLKSKIIVITNKEIYQDKEIISLILPKISTYAFPYAGMVAGQLLALYTSLEKGLNPDVPRSLSKVTITV